MEKEGVYKDGKISGLLTEWYSNGVVKMESVYGDDNIKIQKIYYDNGQLQKECNYLGYGLEGLCIEYFKTGIIDKSCIYKNNKMNGLLRRFHENGQLKLEGIFEDGKANGYYKMWHPNGKIQRECTYQNNLYIGPYVERYANGKIKILCNYIIHKNHNAYDGEYKEFDEYGSIIKTCVYRSRKETKRRVKPIPTEDIDESDILAMSGYAPCDDDWADYDPEINKEFNNLDSIFETLPISNDY